MCIYTIVKQSISLVSLVVREYDEAIAFYVQTLGFTLVAYKSRGVEFVREPRPEPYGTVAVFKDLYGTLWDLVQWSDPGKGR